MPFQRQPGAKQRHWRCRLALEIERTDDADCDWRGKAHAQEAQLSSAVTLLVIRSCPVGSTYVENPESRVA